jgi:hypothetical protein
MIAMEIAMEITGEIAVEIVAATNGGLASRGEKAGARERAEKHDHVLLRPDCQYLGQYLRYRYCRYCRTTGTWCSA